MAVSPRRSQLRPVASACEDVNALARMQPTTPDSFLLRRPLHLSVKSHKSWRLLQHESLERIGIILFYYGMWILTGNSSSASGAASSVKLQAAMLYGENCVLEYANWKLRATSDVGEYKYKCVSRCEGSRTPRHRHLCSGKGHEDNTLRWYGIIDQKRLFAL